MGVSVMMLAKMIRYLSVSLLAAGCTVLSATPAVGQCRDSSKFSTIVREQMLSAAIGTDSASAYWRSVYQLDQVNSASQVTFIEDSTVCRAAADAMGALRQPSRDHTSFPLGMWVLAVGPTRYVVFDGQQHVAGSHYVTVFDHNFNYVDVIKL